MEHFSLKLIFLKLQQFLITLIGPFTDHLLGINHQFQQHVLHISKISLKNHLQYVLSP